MPRRPPTDVELAAMMQSRPPGDRLTVVIVDTAPLQVAELAPVRRTVRIKLTDEQRAELMLTRTGFDCGRPIFESIERVIAEPLSHETRICDCGMPAGAVWFKDPTARSCPKCHKAWPEALR